MAARSLLWAALLAGLASAPALAQQSTSYKVTEWVLNEGGHPLQGGVLTSTSYHIRLDALGEHVGATPMSSTSYRSDTGFSGAYPLPGEVQRLLFSNKTTLAWNADKSAGTYNVYRGLVSSLPGLTFGACFASALTTPTAPEPSKPSTNTAWFYLVTARNRLREEGTKGRQSNGVERANSSPCP